MLYTSSLLIGLLIGFFCVFGKSDKDEETSSVEKVQRARGVRFFESAGQSRLIDKEKSGKYIPERLLVKRQSSSAVVDYLMDYLLGKHAGMMPHQAFMRVKITIESLPPKQMIEVFEELDKRVKARYPVWSERHKELYCSLWKRVAAEDLEMLRHWVKSAWMKDLCHLDWYVAKSVLNEAPMYAYELRKAMNIEPEHMDESDDFDSILLEHLAKAKRWDLMSAIFVETDFAPYWNETMASIPVGEREALAKAYFAAENEKVEAPFQIFPGMLPAYDRSLSQNAFVQACILDDAAAAEGWVMRMGKHNASRFAKIIIGAAMEKPNYRDFFSDELVNFALEGIKQEDWKELEENNGYSPSKVKVLLELTKGGGTVQSSDLVRFIQKHPDELFGYAALVEDVDERFVLVKSLLQQKKIFRAQAEHVKLVRDSDFSETRKEELLQVVDKYLSLEGKEGK